VWVGKKMNLFKKSCFPVFLGSFYFVLLNSLLFCSESEKQAERLFAEGLFPDAAVYFEETIHQGEPKSSTYLNLGIAYLELEEPQKTLDLLKNLNPFENRQEESERLYLISIAYRRLGNYQAVLSLLQTNVPSNILSLEKGIALYHLQRFAEAEGELNKIEWKEDQALFQDLSQLVLIRLAIEKKEMTKAKGFLKAFRAPSSLIHERAFLEGVCHYIDHDYAKATFFFEEALSNCKKTKSEWLSATLYYLTESYLKEAQSLEKDHPRLKTLFSKADETLQKLLKLEKNEKNNLLLIDYYLMKSQKFQEGESYQKAAELIANSEWVHSSEGKKQAFLKQALGAPSYKERAFLFNNLKDTQDPLIWFHIALNDYNEAVVQEDNDLFEKAALAFDKAYSLFTPNQQHSDAPPEIYQMIGELSLLDLTNELKEKSREILQKGIKRYPQDHGLNILLGKLYLQEKKWKEADAIFASMPQDPEALFFRAQVARFAEDESLSKDCFEKVYTNHSTSPFAPPAYFHYYTFREYIRGQRKAIKHLQAMPLLYENHPLTISSFYLIGLDHKKNHLTEEGKIVRRKDLIAAIDAFQLAESTFDKLLIKENIPSSDIGYFTQVRYRAILERALSNFAIAQESEGGKKLIYLEYSEKVFKDLIEEFQKPKMHLSKYLIQGIPYPKILEEAQFGLAHAYLAKNRLEEANQIFDRMLEQYSQANMNQSYLLSRVWYEKGVIAKKKKDEKFALASFFKSEEAAQGHHFLSPDEKLDLWIQQSLCYKNLHQLNEAMKLLSKVVNDETISHLRVKAMYLRAELYAMEGRKELALKQLVATSKKGGEWGKKAKEKLEIDYANE
jgi:tetratricopeptide (TPR) repeat protein